MRPYSLIRLATLALLALATASCASLGQVLVELLRERPPQPLDQVQLVSDVRLDSLGRIAGTFAGNGTDREVHLLSSDTAFVAELLRRYGPGNDQRDDRRNDQRNDQRDDRRDDRRNDRRDDPWRQLARARLITIVPRHPGDPPPSGPAVRSAIAASPDGHTDVDLRAILLRPGSCTGRGRPAWDGARAELILTSDAQSRRNSDGRGPALGSLRNTPAAAERSWRYDPPPPSDAMLEDLLSRTERTMDSTLNANLGKADAPLDAPLDAARHVRIKINTLDDVDAAEVRAFQVDASRVRYVVALRERRTTRRGESLLAATVMIWDSTGAWQQTVLRPTLLALHGGRVYPWRWGWTPVFWRRIEAISGFGLPRDYLWLEQVGTDDRTVVWAALDPLTNGVVASSEVGERCS